MRNLLALTGAVALAIIAYGDLRGAKAMPWVDHQTTLDLPIEKTGYYRRHYRGDYVYPRPGCTFTIRELQRFWAAQLWPPSMRCFPYPH